MSSLIITYYTHYGVAPDVKSILIDTSSTSEYVLTNEDLPILNHDYHAFQGWSHNGVVISSGHIVTCGDDDTNITLVAVWDDTKQYVITEKSEIIALADAVREITGSTELMTTRTLATAVAGIVETDPTVPDWAKAETKPTYTASEVGAAETEHIQSASTISEGTFVGQVVANSSAQSPSVFLLRNSKLVTTETNPTTNGEICWMYE